MDQTRLKATQTRIVERDGELMLTFEQDLTHACLKRSNLLSDLLHGGASEGTAFSIPLPPTEVSLWMFFSAREWSQDSTVYVQGFGGAPLPYPVPRALLLE